MSDTSPYCPSGCTLGATHHDLRTVVTDKPGLVSLSGGHWPIGAWILGDLVLLRTGLPSTDLPWQSVVGMVWSTWSDCSVS